MDGAATKNNWPVVAKELYTKREKERHHIPDSWADTIDIPKTRIFWNFGCRFPIDEIVAGDWDTTKTKGRNAY